MGQKWCSEFGGWFEAGGWICVTLGRGVSAYVVAMGDHRRSIQRSLLATLAVSAAVVGTLSCEVCFDF